MVLHFSHDYSTPFTWAKYKGACHFSLLQHQTKIFLLPAFLIISSTGNKLVVSQSPNRHWLNNYTINFCFLINLTELFKQVFPPFPIPLYNYFLKVYNFSATEKIEKDHLVSVSTLIFRELKGTSLAKHFSDI